MQQQSQLHPFFQKYDLLETLGTGAFSVVRVGVDRATGQKYAIKIIDKSKCKGKEDMIHTEVKILSMVRHENIVQLFEMYQFDEKIYLVMELVTGGELFDEIMHRGTFTELDAARTVKKILEAVDYLHSNGIVHRDLKPENLLISDRNRCPVIKLSDFGLSKIYSDVELMRTACGTPGYVAPEVLKKRGYGPQVDLWSLGVITYILLCGYPPFFDANNTELFKKIMAGSYKFDRPWWDRVSNRAKDFICKLLVVDANARWTAKQALQHPFIADCPELHLPTHRPIFQPPVIERPLPTPIPQLSIPVQVTIPQTITKPKVSFVNKAKAQKPKIITGNPFQLLMTDDPTPIPFTKKVNRIASWFKGDKDKCKHQ